MFYLIEFTKPGQRREYVFASSFLECEGIVTGLRIGGYDVKIVWQGFRRIRDKEERKPRRYVRHDDGFLY